MEELSIAEAWSKFEAGVVPAHASREQRFDMWMSFYSGALYVVRCMDTVAKLPDDVGYQFLDMIHDEADAFYEAMQRHAKKDLQ